MAICRVSAGHCLAFFLWDSSYGRSAGPIWYESEPCLFLCRTIVSDQPVYIVSFCDGSITVVYFSARKYHPAAALTTAQIWFGFDSASGVTIVFTALFGILRHHVWLARNKHRFEHVTPHALLTIKCAKSTSRFLVWMHRRRCSPEVFERDWLVSRIVGSVTKQDCIRFTRGFIT